jgi:hypothetical protein
MKKIILLSSVVLLTAVFLSSCVKTVNRNFDEGYWLNQERADVVYSDSYCGYYVVETAYGYTVIHSLGGRPYEGDVMYGNFGGYGSRDFYNYSAGTIIRGDVVEYDLSYFEAQNAVDYYCPYAKTNGGGRIKQSATSENKIKRTVVQQTPASK